MNEIVLGHARKRRVRKVPQPLDATALRNAKNALRFGRGLRPVAMRFSCCPYQEISMMPMRSIFVMPVFIGRTL